MSEQKDKSIQHILDSALLEVHTAKLLLQSYKLKRHNLNDVMDVSEDILQTAHSLYGQIRQQYQQEKRNEDND